LYLWRFIIYSSSFVIIFNLKEVGLINEKTIIEILGLVGIVITFLGFLQLIFFPKFDNPLFPLTEWGFDPHQGRLTSTFLDPNFVGAFLVLTLGLIIFKLIQSVRKVLLLQAVALILAIVLTFSRSAYLMLGTFVILGGVFIWNKVSKKQKYTFLLLCFLSLVGLSLVFPRFLERVSGGISLDKSSAERVVSWRNGWEIFQNKPILGVGFNNYRFAQEQKNLFKTYSADGGHAGGGADSWVIFILATTGLLGLVVYIVFWIKVLKILLSQKTSLGLVLFLLLSSLLINGQFINSLFFPPIMLWYFVALGISVKAEK
jgi:O-antigen ligase